MNERVFIDSNIWLYSFLRQDEEKRKAAKTLIKSRIRKLVVAAALTRNCNILYSEDMQNGQVFEGQLKIKNPFTDIKGNL